MVWGVVLVASVFFAPELSGRLKGGGFEGSNSEAERVQRPDVRGVRGLSGRPDGGLRGRRHASAEREVPEGQQERALEEVRELDEVRYVASYAGSEDGRFISKDGEKSYAVIAFNVSIDETRNVVEEVRAGVRSDELETYVTGAPAVYQDLERASNEDVKRAEKYAFPFAIVILIFAFGTLVAAGVPVLIGGASVLTSLAALYFIAGFYDMSVFTLTLSTMLGLGLGIDYALFFVSRFREELENFPAAEAVPRTVATAGRSIFFSGTAVLIGLSGLLFFPFMFMRSIGVAGVVVVFVSVLAALTLLPAFLGILGHRINLLSIRRRRDGLGTGFWSRSADVVMRRPVIVILLVAVILGTLLYPVSPHEGGYPRGERPPREVRVARRGRHPEGELRVRRTQPHGGGRHRLRRPARREGASPTRRISASASVRPRGSRSVESVYTVGATAARRLRRPASPKPARKRRARPPAGWTPWSGSRSRSRPGRRPTRWFGSNSRK